METEVGLEIKNQLLKKNCELKTFIKKSENIIYICACGIEKKQLYKNSFHYTLYWFTGME